jgi:hypothetical protein
MESNFLRINFAESKIPIFKENKAKGYLTYGEDNNYPQMLINFYNSSPKHGAIVTQKAAFISGDKTEIIGSNTEDIARANDYLNNINAYESFDEVKTKIAQDLELFDGFALEIIWNKAKTSIAEIYHLPFQNVRIGLDGSYMYSEEWSNRRIEPVVYYPYNPTTREAKQLYFFKMYKAGCGEYPTAPYQSALKYIEIDTEIANFHLNSIKSGFSAQTLLQLFKGLPTGEEARNTIRRFKENFSGTDNAGSIIIQFNEPNETPSIVNNLAPSDFDKQFDILNKTVQEEILMAHRVTSPMLFGIKTEGQLGGRNELIEAYEAFQTSYIEPRQNQLDRCLTSIFKYIVPVTLKTKNKPPIGLDYTELYAKGLMSLDEARNELGLAKQKDQKTVVDSINNLSPLVANKVIDQMTINEIRSIAGLPAIPEGNVPSKTPTEMSVAPSKAPSEAPSCDCNPFGWDDDKDLEVFTQFGEDADNFESVPMQFGDALQTMILQWIYSNKGISIQDLANNINKSVEEIQAEIVNMVNNGFVIYENNQLNIQPDGVDALDNSGVQTEIVTMWKYDKAPGISGGKIIGTSRDFCKRMISLNRVYTRAEIDQISSILASQYNDPGYSAWKRRGGWMTVKNSKPAVHVPYCRHIWQPQLLRRKING